MRIQITGRNIAISDPIAKYVNKRVGKFDRLFGDDVEAQVRLSIDRYRQICEVTIPLRGVTLRAEEATNDMYTSIDNVIGKLERQIRKYRTRLEKRMRQDADTAEVYEAPFQEAEAIKQDYARHKEILPVVKAVVEKMASIVNRYIDKAHTDAIYLCGGTCCLTGIEGIFEKETGIRTIKPANPFLVTPAGIAMNCKV